MANSLKFAPVVVLMSLDTRLAIMDTSLLVLFLRLLKNFRYLTKISVLAVARPGDNTCCTRYALVSLGQD